MKHKKLILCTITIAAITIIAAWKMPLAVKYITGTARILQQVPEARIYIDDSLQTDIKIFQANKNFDGSPRGKILLFDESGVTIPEKVIAIFPEQKNVCFTNSSKKDYQNLFGYLAESELGARGNVAMDNKAKGAGFDPRLNFTCNAIRFRIVRNNVSQNFKVIY